MFLESPSNHVNMTQKLNPCEQKFAGGMESWVVDLSTCPTPTRPQDSKGLASLILVLNTDNRHPPPHISVLPAHR